MVYRSYALEYTLLAGIVLIALINVGLYGACVQRGDAVQIGALAGTVPGGNAPGVIITPSPAQLAELDHSPELPGTYVAPQGKRHTAQWPLAQRILYCAPGEVSDACYASKPATSGLHLPVQQRIQLADGARVDLPPEPGVYDVDFPRETIPHIQEHAGVFIGYHCVSDACREAVELATIVVQQELSLKARVVLAPFSDLDDDTFGVASWTRFDAFPAGDYTDERVREFIKAHSCRYDPERFCPGSRVN